MRNRGTQRTSVLWDRASRTHRSHWNPRGLMWGHPARCPRLGYVLLQTVHDGQASGGQEGVAPCIPTRAGPLDPGLTNATNAHPG